MEPLPAEPVSIEYQTPADSPLRPFIRLMAGATIAKGVSNALYWIWYLSRYTFPMRRAMDRLEMVVFASYLLPTLFSLGLAGGGWLCWNFAARGRRVVIWLSAITAVLAVFTTAVEMLRFFSAAMVLRSTTLPTLINLVGTLVLPVTIWVFFRRPEVAAAMREE